MQLDRFTQKAQEAIIAAQATAERLHSPVLDAEHLLSALIDPDDGIPAETLRRLGVDLPAFRGEVAAVAGHARPDRGRLAQPGSARQGGRRAGGGRGPSPGRRLRLDRAPPARRRRGRRRRPGHPRAAWCRQGGAPAGAAECPRRPARDLPEPGGHVRRAREVRPRPDRRGTGRAARSRHRSRRRDPPRHPGAQPADEEQPRPHRGAGRRQDGDRRGPRPAHRARRRAGRAEGQARGRAGPRCAHRRGEVPRRVRGAAQGRAQGDQGLGRPGHPVHRRAPHGGRRRARPRARWTPRTC